MNIDHLKLFSRIAITNNISQAGNELGLSPAVASAHINKLEDALGARLIHRTTRKVSLTEEGLSFLPHAEQVLEHIEAARASVGAGEASPKGTLRVAASASFAHLHLIPALSDFLTQYPELEVDFRLSDTIVDMVEGGFDVAIRIAALNDSSFVARKLADDQRIIVASPTYLENYGTPKTPQDLTNHQCLSLVGLENWQFKDGQSIKTSGHFKADNGQAIRQAATDGLGITISSIWCCYKQLKSGELVQILPSHPLSSHTAIWAVYPSSRLIAPKVRAFIDFCVARFGDRPYWNNSLSDPSYLF
ncbi:LysR family transcriptional regulator [Thalassotalea sp. M1531]|uniref:LysR family transcriptional regulator n=1 Tax=Thalassotalea algicola TaxID=2716224 RepID=A0A7Y0Q5M8_9GAMM|nr:LysR family transcriptional regulator [Thalassotalea algicola]NMP31159.1 LysR family transcriptional regulator [Thalassotalea algicola]